MFYFFGFLKIFIKTIKRYDTEIEILIKKLQSQHYLGRHFDLTIENCELIFQKAEEFSLGNNFELGFLFETKLSPILEASIKEQHDILIDASKQRSKLELDDIISKQTDQSNANYEQNRKVQIEKLLNYLTQNELTDYFSEVDLHIIKVSTSSALQFSCGVLSFFCDCLRIYYQEISFCLVETVTKLFKLELKLYANFLTKNTNSKNNRIKKQDILNNVCCLEKVFLVIEKLYFKKTGVHSKYFLKLTEKFTKFKEDYFN